MQDAALWQRVRQLQEEDAAVVVTVVKPNRGGFVVQFVAEEGAAPVRGFMPRSLARQGAGPARGEGGLLMRAWQ